jgi:hypothetical protein
LLNQNGEVIDELLTGQGEKSYGINMAYNTNQEGAKSLEPGNYRALWYSDGELISQWRFSVKDENK